MITLFPQVYNGDYKSKKEVVKAFENNKDFKINNPIGEYSKWHGAACNKEDLLNMGITKVRFRYNKLQEILTIDVEEK